MMDGLLAFSRLGRRPLARERVDVAALVRTLFGQVRESMPEKPIELVVGELPPAAADPAMLEALLRNLVTNAVKFSREREKARVEVGWVLDVSEAGAEQTAYFVRDNGVGFDPRFAEKMFGVFERLHADFEGTGVGLALVARIARRHGGRVWAEGEPGRGATFYFTLAEGARSSEGREDEQ
jgi:light-regulated signal transduction histidine kinase (bacteriophytochrome)